MLDRTVIKEALDVSESRQRTRPRPLYGLRYRTLEGDMISAQETAYARKLIELPDGLPFAMPIWMDRVQLTADLEADASVLTVETTDLSLWDTFDSYALIWTDFQTWEVVALNSVSGTTIVLSNPVASAWAAGTWIIPLAIGHLKRNDRANFTSDHARFQVDFEEKFLSITSEFVASSGSSTCCQISGRYFQPAYSASLDRIGVGHRGSGSSQYTSAKVRVLAPECSGVGEIAETRASGGATHFGDRFYIGCQGGSGGSSGDELVAVVNGSSLATTFIGGFPNPTGIAKGLNGVYIASTGRIWVQLSGCGGDNAFAIIDPLYDIFTLVSDATLATCFENAWVYCAENDCIYCACADGVFVRVDVVTLTVTPIDLSALGVSPASLLLGGVAYTDPAPANPASGKIWLAYQNSGVIPTQYGIVMFDPSDDSVFGGFPSDRLHTILWYAGAYDFVLGNGGLNINSIIVYSSAFSEGFPLGNQVEGYAMTAAGCYIDSNAKLLIPTYTDGEYCLTYFSPSLSGLSADQGFITEGTSRRMYTEVGDRMLEER
jgi:hypothetical protein